jgi:hypothetical protein
MTTIAGGLEREVRLTDALSDLRSKKLQPTVHQMTVGFLFVRKRGEDGSRRANLGAGDAIR